MYTFKEIDQLSPDDFERFIKEILTRSGWKNVTITKVGEEYRYGDGGVDIFAYKNKRRYAIEVKKRSLDSHVTVDALNQLITGAELAQVTNKILVTNSYFTSEVQARALILGVELIDRDKLKDLYETNWTEIGRQIRPRKYQQKIIDTCLSKYKNGAKKLLIEMATGLGKTYTAALLIKQILNETLTDYPKVLFIAHQVEILQQTSTAFKNVFGVGNKSFSVCFAGNEPGDTDMV